MATQERPQRDRFVDDLGDPPAIEVARKRLVSELADQNIDVGLGRTEDGQDALVLFPRDPNQKKPGMKEFDGFPVVEGADNLGSK